ncbi:MAG TPA: alpha/beta fold hydrolase [Longimicrobiales bacterium]|nr:alpha/beta fold hydrolase [Longimicrobiales bacterium]
MYVSVLGPAGIRSAGGSLWVPAGTRQRLLLAALALHAPRAVSPERLMDILWGEAPPSDPHAALRTQVSRLRSCLSRLGLAHRLRPNDGIGYALELNPDELDASVFEALQQRAASAARPAEALAATDRALTLWRDEPYGEFRHLPHFAGEAVRLRDLWLGVCERRIESLLALERTDDAHAAAVELVVSDPLRERSRALLMRVLYLAGRQGEALECFQDYRRLLAEELGLSPSPALRTLEQQILQHALAADGVSAAVPPGFSGDPPSTLRPRHRQRIRFARSADNCRLAFATVGSGPPLVKAANWLNHLEFDWESPVWRRLFNTLADRHTLIRYDERGCGLSDADPVDMSLDAWVADLECVADACGLHRFPLVGISQGVAVCVEYAARHPDRVTALVLHGGYAAGWRADPSFGPAEIARRDASIEIVRHGWGEDTAAYRQMFTQTFIPDGTPDEIAWFNELQRRTTTPANAARFMEAFAYIDVRHRLASVRVPTLVLHSRGDQRIPCEKGLDLARGIPGARFMMMESRNHLILEHEPAFDAWVTAMLEFLAASTVGRAHGIPAG